VWGRPRAAQVSPPKLGKWLFWRRAARAAWAAAPGNCGLVPPESVLFLVVGYGEPLFRLPTAAMQIPNFYIGQQSKFAAIYYSKKNSASFPYIINGFDFLIFLKLQQST
jgi:hypothetical protein